MGKRFGGIGVDVVYSRDLTRTRVTVEAVAGVRGGPLFLTPRVREVDVGDWEDRTWGEVERFEPEQLYNFNNDPTRWRINGCEDFYSLQRRLTEAIRGIAERHSGKTVAVVSPVRQSGFFIRVMGFLKRNPARAHSDNTAVAFCAARPENSGRIYWGQLHLPRELSTFAHQKWWRENTTFDSTNLRFAPFDLESGADAARYLEYRRDARPWVGDAAEGWDALLETARSRVGADPRAVSLALIYDTPVGMVELDTKSGAAEKTGVIDYLYMAAEQRRTGIAVQLLGHAVSVCGRWVRKAARVCH
jgi:probable phosphoglycerate mutase